MADSHSLAAFRRLPAVDLRLGIMTRLNEAPAEFRSIPALPPPAGRVVSVTTVAELLRAARDVQSHTTILVQAGRYVLTEPLRLGRRDQSQPLSRVALRGATGTREDVIIEIAASQACR